MHREYIKTGLWPVDIGVAFDTIWELRDMGNYGGTTHVTENEARQAVQTARQILEIIAGSCPELKY